MGRLAGVFLVLAGFLIVVAVCLMLDGRILGERTDGVGDILGLIGVLIIFTSGVKALKQRPRTSSW